MTASTTVATIATATAACPRALAPADAGSGLLGRIIDHDLVAERAHGSPTRRNPLVASAGGNRRAAGAVNGLPRGRVAGDPGALEPTVARWPAVHLRAMALPADLLALERRRPSVTLS